MLWLSRGRCLGKAITHLAVRFSGAGSKVDWLDLFQRYGLKVSSAGLVQPSRKREFVLFDPSGSLCRMGQGRDSQEPLAGLHSLGQ